MGLRAVLETGRQALEQRLLQRWFVPAGRPRDWLDRLALDPLACLVRAMVNAWRAC